MGWTISKRTTSKRHSQILWLIYHIPNLINVQFLFLFMLLIQMFLLIIWITYLQIIVFNFNQFFMMSIQLINTLHYSITILIKMISQNHEGNTSAFHQLFQKRQKYDNLLRNLKQKQLSLQIDLNKYQHAYALIVSEQFQNEISSILQAGEQLSQHLIKKQQDDEKNMAQGFRPRSQNMMSFDEIQDKISEMEYLIELQQIRKERIEREWKSFHDHMNHLQSIKHNQTQELRKKLQHNRQRIDNNPQLSQQILKIIRDSPSLQKQSQYLDLIKQHNFEQYICQQNQSIVELNLKVNQLKEQLIPILTKYQKCRALDQLKALQFNKYQGLKQIKNIQDLQKEQGIINNELFELEKQLNVTQAQYDFMLNNQAQNIQNEVRSQMKRYNGQKRNEINNIKAKIDNFLILVSGNQDQSIKKQLQDIMAKYQEIKRQQRDL